MRLHIQLRIVILYISTVMGRLIGWLQTDDPCVEQAVSLSFLSVY
jgi:hypothetical protein